MFLEQFKNTNFRKYLSHGMFCYTESSAESRLPPVDSIHNEFSFIASVVQKFSSVV